MDKRLLQYYERELHHVRTSAGEFAREFPKIAGRLALEEFSCGDPYVERLLEGFAYMAARVQLKIDAEFPRFTQGLLETVFPHYLAPTPSMAVVQFNPDMADSALAQGIAIPRNTVLRSVAGLGVGERTQCEYRTAHEISLWPIQVASAAYHGRDMGVLEIDPAAFKGLPPIKSAIALTLRSSPTIPFSKIELDKLPLFLRGEGSHPMRIYEQLLAHCRAVVVRPTWSSTRERNEQGFTVLGQESIRRVGFDQEQQLLPYDARSFQGYRLLAEYFAFPQRFLFVEVAGLSGVKQPQQSNGLEIIFLLDDDEAALDGVVQGSNFALHCTPAVNLFPKLCDRIFVTERTSEFHIIPDRTRPIDFEVYRILSATGFGSRTGEEKIFRPLFALSEADDGTGSAYYVASRVPRVLSEREREQGRRSSYPGSEVHLSIVDAQAAPFSVDLKQLGTEALCTNRDLPLQMPLGKGRSDFSLEIGVPVTSTRIVAGPTKPRASSAEGETSWRLVSHQALNYLSLTDAGEREGSAGLRDMLKLYGDMGDAVIRKQIDAVRSVQASPVVRRVPTPGPITFARGLEITATLEERGFEGTGVFAFGAVLEQFFARYVGLNSFTETVIRTVERDMVMRWPARLGQRPLV